MVENIPFNPGWMKTPFDFIQSKKNVGVDSCGFKLLSFSQTISNLFATVLKGLWNVLLYCPAVLSHFSPAPVDTDRVVRIQ